MSEAKKSSKRNIIVLTGICLVAALSLAITYTTTKERINFSERQESLKAVSIVIPTGKDGNPLYKNEPDKMQFTMEIKEPQKIVESILTFFPALNDKGEVLGFAIKITSKIGYAGNIDFMLGIDTEGRIFGFEILAQNETPGLGTKISEDFFKKQFPGKSLQAGDHLMLKKDNREKGDIDAISGATISSRAITNAIRTVLEYYKAHKEEIISKGKGIDFNPVSGLSNN